MRVDVVLVYRQYVLVRTDVAYTRTQELHADDENFDYSLGNVVEVIFESRRLWKIGTGVSSSLGIDT